MRGTGVGAPRWAGEEEDSTMHGGDVREGMGMVTKRSRT